MRLANSSGMWALPKASSTVILPAAQWLYRASSISCMPNLAPVWIARVDAEGLVFADQVGDPRSDDQHFVGGHAAAADFGHAAFEPRRRSASVDSCVRTWSCRLPGKASMMRLTVPWALLVCSVPKTMWPVSAALIAASIVSKSRISPTRITSGSCRRARRIASEKLGTSTPTSRWLIVDLLVVVVELDRVFDRDDVVVDGLVDVVDQAGQRRALARAGRSGDQEQAARTVDQLDARHRAAPTARGSACRWESAAAPSR